MSRILIIISCLFNFAFSTTNQDLIWNKGETLITFLINHNINKDVYFNLSKTDKELCTEIEAGIEYRLIKADNGAVLHALIPISEEMQIHIHYKKGQYVLDIIPVIYETKTELLTFKLTSSPYQDIVNFTKNKHLASEFIKAFHKSINFKKVHEGDVVALKYEQKVRMGRYYGSPVVLGAFVRPQHQDEKYVYQNPDDSLYYDEKGKSFSSVLFRVPVAYKRISSDFTYKRFHPVLKYYRAHLGTDLSASVGTKIVATSNGRISHFGVKGGYGNTIIINHDGGFKSLYGHLSRYNKQLRAGMSVKQGDLIGFVGSSGVSSGPHLHFGMYKNGRAMDPMKIVKSTKKVLSGITLQKYLKNANSIKKELEISLLKNGTPFKLDEIQIFSPIKK